MARTKQTARKNSSGKHPAMGKPKPLSNPKPGGRADQKVIIEYLSDKSFDEDNVQLVEGSGVPKGVKKQIHLTLPTSPTHVTTTETFTTFFINHGLTKALRKAFQKWGWRTDDLQELMTKLRQQGPRTARQGQSRQEDSRWLYWRQAGKKEPYWRWCRWQWWS